MRPCCVATGRRENGPFDPSGERGLRLKKLSNYCPTIELLPYYTRKRWRSHLTLPPSGSSGRNRSSMPAI